MKTFEEEKATTPIQSPWGYPVFVIFEEYATTGHYGIRLVVAEADEDLGTWKGERVGVATVNLPPSSENPLGPKEVWIKDYSENEGIKDCLMEADIIGAALDLKVVGYPVVTKHSILVEDIPGWNQLVLSELGQI